jgi:hypothetical protein
LFINSGLSLISNEEEFLNEHFYTEINRRFDCDFSEIAKNIRLVKSNKFNLKISVSNLDNAFKLCFGFKDPVNYLLSEKVGDAYDYIFKYIFKLLTLHSIVSKVFSVCKNTRGYVIKPLAKVFKTFFQVYKFLNSYMTFFFCEVIDSNFKAFMNRLNMSVDIYEIIEIQNECLNTISSVLKSKIVEDIEKIYINIAKIHLKVFIYDSLSEEIADDIDFLEIVKKIEKKMIKLRGLIKEETILGSFFNLKTYI